MPFGIVIAIAMTITTRTLIINNADKRGQQYNYFPTTINTNKDYFHSNTNAKDDAISQYLIETKK